MYAIPPRARCVCVRAYVRSYLLTKKNVRQKWKFWFLSNGNNSKKNTVIQSGDACIVYRYLAWQTPVRILNSSSFVRVDGDPTNSRIIRKNAPCLNYSTRSVVFRQTVDRLVYVYGTGFALEVDVRKYRCKPMVLYWNKGFCVSESMFCCFKNLSIRTCLLLLSYSIQTSIKTKQC